MRSAVGLVVALLLPTCGMLAGIQRSGAKASPASIAVPIFPVNHSGVRGTLVLREAGQRTMAVVTLRYLPLHARAWIGLKSGRCSDLHHISASTLFLPTLTENAQGTATGNGRVHGPDAAAWNRDVEYHALLRLGVIATVSTRAGWVACGRVP